jgi:hypothetical protein
MSLFFFNTAANLIFIGAYWVKDILWLRVLSIVGSLVILPYYYLQPEPLWEPMMWSFVYMAIHGFRAWGIIQERRPVEFSDEENTLYKKTFDNLSPQQFKKILKIGQWQDLDKGVKVQSEGDPAENVVAVTTGELKARKSGRVLGSYGPGDLIGLGCIMTNAKEFCDTTVTRPARVMRWNYPELKKILDADQNLAFALEKTAGATLAANLIKVLQPA